MRKNNNQILEPQSQTVARAVQFSPVVRAENESVGNQFERPSFLDGPANAISLADLKTKCVVPCWPSGEPCISHPLFIEQIRAAAATVFGTEYLEEPEIRTSHPQRSRNASALEKHISEVSEQERYLWYERMCFCIVISATDIINGQETRLIVGGVRAMNNENIRSRRGIERFKIFISTRVTICSNLCIFTDGTIDKLEVTEASQIYDNAVQLFQNFNPDLNRHRLEMLNQTTMSTEDFSHIVGKLRIYEALSNAKRNELALPQILLGDQTLNAAVKEFTSNPNFGVGDADSISCWQFLNYLNASCRNSYIDRFIDKQVNAMDLSIGIARALNHEDDSYSWFLR